MCARLLLLDPGLAAEGCLRSLQTHVRMLESVSNCCSSCYTCLVHAAARDGIRRVSAG